MHCATSVQTIVSQYCPLENDDFVIDNVTEQLAHLRSRLHASQMLHSNNTYEMVVVRGSYLCVYERSYSLVSKLLK